jgi:lambda family phage portal protein
LRSNDLTLAENFLDLKADYAAARASRFRRVRTGIPSLGAGSDYHYRNESDWLRVLEYARDMDRNDCIVGQTIDRAVLNTIQTGFDLEPQTGDPELDKDLWQRYCDWSCDPNQCDEAGELTVWQMDELALRHRFVDGDIFINPLDNRHLQLVEAHRARTPSNTKKNVIHGVLLSPTRRRLEYWFTRDDIDPMQSVSRVSDMKPYAAWTADGEKAVLQIYDPKRVSQTRGLSALMPIFDVSGMFEDVQFAKLVQQVVVSSFAVFRELDIKSQPGPAAARGSEFPETRSDGTLRTVQGIGPGMQIQGRPGEKLTGFSPAVPNPEFFDHVKLILTMIGVNLGMPLVLVMLDSSETNFSGWRGAVDQARLGFRRNQHSMIVQAKRPVYRWWLKGEMASDAALRSAFDRLGITFFRHSWNAPRWPYIQPLQDAEADSLRLASRLTSPRRLHAERGQDYDDVLAECIGDNASAVRQAIAESQAVETDTGVKVDWHEFLHLGGTKPLTGSIRNDGQGDGAAGNKGANDATG